MEASRSVLSRDWALWNSTTAAAAILPLSHRPRPRPPTPETHSRKARPRLPLPPMAPTLRLPEHYGSCSLAACRGLRGEGKSWGSRARGRQAPQHRLAASPRVKEAVPKRWNRRLSPHPPQKRPRNSNSPSSPLRGLSEHPPRYSLKAAWLPLSLPRLTIHLGQ